MDVCSDIHKTTKYFLTEEDDEKFLNDPEPVLGEDDEEDKPGEDADKEYDEEKLAEELEVGFVFRFESTIIHLEKEKRPETEPGERCQGHWAEA